MAAPRGGPPRRALGAAVAMSLTTLASAQDATPAARLPLTIVPSFAATATLTYSDGLQPSTPRSELVTTLSPGVRINSTAGPVRGFLDYGLKALYFTGNSGHSEIQHALSAAATAEIVERRFLIDAGASISQQAISAFGPQFTDTSLARTNRTEVRAYSLSPSLRGSIAGAVDYVARVSQTGSQSAGVAGASSHSLLTLLQLNGRPQGPLNWSVAGSRQRLNYNAGDNSQSDRLDGSLSYAATPQLNLTLQAGRESTDLGGLFRQTANTHGYGVAWQPSPTTSLTANQQSRPFGRTHQFNISHRTPRTIWTYNDTRDVASGAAQPVFASLGTAYDNLFQQFASQIPDPDLRAAEVTRFLTSRGINPNAQVIGSFVSSSATLQRLQTLSVMLLGVRQTISLAASQGLTTRLDQTVGPFDLSNTSFVRQQGFNIGVSHRLTPLSSINLTASQQRTLGDDKATRLQSFDISWSGQIGFRTRATLSARHSVFDGSTTSAYSESALSAGLNLTF